MGDGLRGEGFAKEAQQPVRCVYVYMYIDEISEYMYHIIHDYWLRSIYVPICEYIYMYNYLCVHTYFFTHGRKDNILPNKSNNRYHLNFPFCIYAYLAGPNLLNGG